MVKRPVDAAAPLRLELTLPQPAVARFFPLLGEGILVRGRGVASVEAFLQQAAGISPAYLREGVQTVFMDGKALDDLGAAAVGAGATIALSAAMPGLAGAVLRRGGFYAAMRRQISHEAAGAAAAGTEITVTLKLFNLVARDLGPRLLAQGILLAGARLCDFMQRQGRWLWTGCAYAAVNGLPVAVSDLPQRVSGEGLVLLQITPLGNRGEV